MPVGDWMRRFLDVTTSPRAKRLVGKNRPYSPKTIADYGSLFKAHLEGDTFLDLTMERATSDDL
jgi:hypothetical protein